MRDAAELVPVHPTPVQGSRASGRFGVRVVFRGVRVLNYVGLGR